MAYKKKRLSLEYRQQNECQIARAYPVTENCDFRSLATNHFAENVEEIEVQEPRRMGTVFE